MSELVVERNPGELRLALRADGRTVEVIHERGVGSQVGSIWWGRVVRVEPGIGAFIDLGGERPGFLPLAGKPPVEGGAVLVQVGKDAYAEKGPEVTTRVALDDGLLMLQPGTPGVAVSRNLPPAQRTALRTRLQEILGKDSSLGVLVHSAARDHGDDLAESWATLSAEWQRIAAIRPGAKPRQVAEAADPLLRALRLHRPEGAVVGDAGIAAKLRPLLGSRVRIANHPFEALGVEDDIQRTLARELSIDGGRLVVDETEAMTVIDVDGGGDVVASNKAAAEAIAHLVRLRNWGGLIVVDFPFGNRSVAEKTDRAVKQAMKRIPRSPDCLGWTRAGLYEMTRPRQGPSLAQLLQEAPALRPTVETAALAALRAVAAAEGGRLRLTAAPEIVAWLQGKGAGALAEAGRPVALAAEPGYGRERFDVTRD